jgi:hypothetical protein
MVLFSRTGLADAAKLFALVRERGDRINLGNSGVGSNSYICGLLVAEQERLRVALERAGVEPAKRRVLTLNFLWCSSKGSKGAQLHMLGYTSASTETHRRNASGSSPAQPRTNPAAAGLGPLGSYNGETE